MAVSSCMPICTNRALANDVRQWDIDPDPELTVGHVVLQTHIHIRGIRHCCCRGRRRSGVEVNSRNSTEEDNEAQSKPRCHFILVGTGEAF
jgi:hypothetical protein